MTFEDRIRIETPEGVDLELTLAGLGSRIGAAIIDALVKGITIAAVLYVLFVIASGVGGIGGAIAIGVGYVLAFLVQFGYDVAFEVLGGGKTIGKRAMGTRVVKASGAPVTFRSSAVRNLLRLVDEQMTLYALGILLILFSSKNQRLGDVVAGTVVVRDRAVASVPTAVEYHYDSVEVYPWDVGRVDRDVVATLRGFLARRQSLAPAVRARIARQLYDRVRPMVGGVSENLAPEAFIEAVVRLKSG